MDFFLFRGILKIGDSMQQYYEMLVKYSSLKDKKSPLTIEENQFLADVNKLVSENSDLKVMISFLEREKNPILRKKIIDINTLKNKEKEVSLSAMDFDIEMVDGERVIIVHEKDPIKRGQLLAQIQGIEQYYLYPELLKRLSPIEEERCKKLVDIYKSKITEPVKVKQKISKPSSKIAGYIDALMMGWFTGLVGSITFSIMLYILSK